MPATTITNPANGESLVGTEPQLLQQVDAGWRHRLNLFTGRALTDTALDSEQAYRAGLLAELGQAVTPGTVSGLALTLDTSGIEPVITVAPGYGIAASGQDVALNTPMKTALSTLTVIDTTGQTVVDPSTDNPVAFHNFVQQPKNTNYVGILLLQPVIAQVSGQALDTGTGPIIVSGNLGASCDQDPSEYGFEDWQIADAVRLVYLPWPANTPNIALTPPPPAPQATWRNRLAYTIFEAEAQLGPDDQMPWSMPGVPVALIAFDPGLAWAPNTAFTAGQFVTDPNGSLQQVQTAGTSATAAPAAWSTSLGATTKDGGVVWVNAGPGWKPLFVDCSSVVRAGGLPRNRYVLPAEAETLLLWQPATQFVAGSFIVDSNNNIQEVQTAGKTGLAAPAWKTALNQNTSDGTVVWVDKGPASWQPNAQFVANQFLFDANGNRQVVETAGTSGSTEPDWNGIYLPTQDGTVVWINNGSGKPPIVQPALAQARINQLSEQITQTLAQQGPISNLAAICPTLPPSGLLPATSVDFVHDKATWFPPNWSLTAAPVFLEELETVLETGMLEAPIATATTAPANADLLEPVEILIPLPDAVYDPDILIQETVAQVFYDEVNKATAARNITLQQIETVTQERNVLYAALGPNVPSNPNITNPNDGLTADEIAGRNAPPPYSPLPAETFGTLLQTTWFASKAYTGGQFAIDGNGAIQVVTTAGTSGAAPPTWNGTVGQSTTDGTAVWLNNGPWAWQPGTAYVAKQFVIDPNGFLQQVQTGGTSAASVPSWKSTKGQTTPDGIVWLNGGKATWRPDTQFSAGQTVIDPAGNVQIVQTAGISGDTLPSWNANVNQTTQDSGVTWNNLGHSRWSANTEFNAGQAIIDGSGMIQMVQIGGTSGALAPSFAETQGGTTTDASVQWLNNGPVTWQASTAYTLGQIILDPNGNLQVVQTQGTSGAKPPAWTTTPGGTTSDGTITWAYLSCYSTDMLEITTLARQSPYTFNYTDASGNQQNVSLISNDDLTDLTTNGLPHFIARLNAKISRANDLLDTAFLTVQADIYRYRVGVLGTAAASALATSPVLANIAAGDTATATATNLQNYINTILPPPGTSAPTYTAPVINYTRVPVIGAATAAAKLTGTAATRAATIASQAVSSAARTNLATGEVINRSTLATTFAAPQLSKTATTIDFAAVTGIAGHLDTGALAKIGPLTSPTQIISPGLNVNAIPTDITNQSPLLGAQANVRTITVAQRLQQSPSQEAMFYSIANRLSFLDSLNALQTDPVNPGPVLNDIQVLVDGTPAPPPATPTVPVAVPVEVHYFSEWLNPSSQGTLVGKLQNPFLIPDSAEATAFSVGIRVAEQHTMMLRAIEARVQQYTDFVNLCTAAVNSIQRNVGQAGVYLTQLQNSLHQERQNVAFTTSLLADETARVQSVNAQRLQILQSSVQIVAYTRARTLDAIDTAPSRQLVPANVANPVPACLQQSVSIPPELREIVGLLREAPAKWMPSILAQLQSFQRPNLLVQFAMNVQARASQVSAAPLLPSSAAGEPGTYAPTISQVYSANLQIFRGFETQRAAFQPSSIVNLSWSAQVSVLQGVSAVNDLISSEASPTEVSNAVARLIQQISSVATCLYARASMALPIDRLAWAEYLSGQGSSAQLQSLAVLPNWNQLSYTDRQQMQLLVDWLFQQIDTSNSSATAFMSDVARTAILLASDVPLDNVIPGNIIARTLPFAGGVVSLNLPSDRIASGMYVNLYSGTDLAARAVVSDLDSSSVKATVTDVFKPGVYLETTDTAQFTAQTPRALALRPLFNQS